MSFGVDVNILLYASDDASPRHAKAAEFLQGCANGGEVFCIAWITVMSYMRMATHPAIFDRPLSQRDAERNVSALIDLPQVRVIGEEEGFWALYREVTTEVPARGNLVPDAHLATILRQHGVRTLYTNDRDFRKFGFIDAQDPLV